MNFFRYKLKAFSILEISVYIAIVGILMLSLVKVKDVVNNAKIQSTIIQIQTIIINSDETDLPTPKIGGIFQRENHLLILSGDNKKGLLSEPQALKFKNQLEENCIIEKTDNNLYLLKINLI